MYDELSNKIRGCMPPLAPKFHLIFWRGTATCEACTMVLCMGMEEYPVQCIRNTLPDPCLESPSGVTQPLGRRAPRMGCARTNAPHHRRSI